MRLSPWATENTPWDTQYGPLWTDAVHFPASGAQLTYSLSMHGAWDRTGQIITYAGHLCAMRFSKLRSNAPFGLRHLVYFDDIAGPPQDTQIAANSGWQPLLEFERAVDAGDIIRATGYLQLETNSPLGIFCRAQMRMSDTAESTTAVKYLTAWREVLPFRVELFQQFEQPGTHRSYALR